MLLAQETTTVAQITDINDLLAELTDDALVSPLLLERYNPWEYAGTDPNAMDSTSISSAKRKHENNEDALVLYDQCLHNSGETTEEEPKKKKEKKQK